MQSPDSEKETERVKKHKKKLKIIFDNFRFRKGSQ